jgi:hypothetical protein
MGSVSSVNENQRVVGLGPGSADEALPVGRKRSVGRALRLDAVKFRGRQQTAGVIPVE